MGWEGHGAGVEGECDFCAGWDGLEGGCSIIIIGGVGGFQWSVDLGFMKMLIHYLSRFRWERNERRSVRERERDGLVRNL